jgi:hypothetical protein
VGYFSLDDPNRLITAKGHILDSLQKSHKFTIRIEGCPKLNIALKLIRAEILELQKFPFYNSFQQLVLSKLGVINTIQQNSTKIFPS